MKDIKYWDDIFYIINLDTSQEVGRYDNYQEAVEIIKQLEQSGSYELVHAIEY